MGSQDNKQKIVKETFSSEINSIVAKIFAGIVLSLIILRFRSFPLLILIITVLLSLRGNIIVLVVDEQQKVVYEYSINLI